jgi:RimJ/RimL family protein N-acetyltransferase
MVTLTPMEQAELDMYLEHVIPDYAKGHVEAGNWDAEGALERSQKEFEVLLPQGVKSPNQYLYSIHEESVGSNIGIIWFAVRDESAGKIAFIYDFELKPEFRGKGYGAESLRAIEPIVQELGLKKISLHVFGKNKVAWHLYEKVGYEVTNVLMSKDLTS